MSDDKIKEIVVNALEEAMTPVVTKMGEEFSRFDQKLRENADLQLAHHEKQRKQVEKLSVSVDHLWRTVRGSEPPDPGDIHAKPLALLATSAHRKASEHEMEIETVKNQIRLASEKLEELLELQKRQTGAMGLERGENEGALVRTRKMIGWMFTETEGTKFLLTALTAILTLMGWGYAATHHDRSPIVHESNTRTD